MLCPIFSLKGRLSSWRLRNKKKKHTIEAVVDRLVVKPSSKTRLADSVETALRMANGTVLININKQDLLYSEQFATIISPIPEESCTECTLYFKGYLLLAEWYLHHLPFFYE
ncbi:MAG: hypothetical protein HGA55_06025 [Methanoregulaceae archaeon]|nr:hypothetical protein [Methanoregulaceae archaeon]